MAILKASLWFALFGLVFGILLAIASKVFAVKKDERAEKMAEILPGANCGGCGYAGCSAYAEAVAKGEAKIGLCNAGGNTAAKKMSEIMGVASEKVVKMRAFVFCSGTNDKVKKKYVYEGAPDCVSASKMGGGDLLCPYGCIGLGSCASVCKSDAIKLIDGVAVVIAEKCIGCGACEKICPKGTIRLVPCHSSFAVSCNSEDKGVQKKSYCSIGCIGCKICEKTCETGAITVDGALAKINYELCTGCGKCAEKCPRKVIIKKDGVLVLSK